MEALFRECQARSGAKGVGALSAQDCKLCWDALGKLIATTVARKKAIKVIGLGKFVPNLSAAASATQPSPLEEGAGLTGTAASRAPILFYMSEQWSGCRQWRKPALPSKNIVTVDLNVAQLAQMAGIPRPKAQIAVLSLIQRLADLISSGAKLTVQVPQVGEISADNQIVEFLCDKDFHLGGGGGGSEDSPPEEDAQEGGPARVPSRGLGSSSGVHSRGRLVSPAPPSRQSRPQSRSRSQPPARNTGTGGADILDLDAMRQGVAPANISPQREQNRTLTNSWTVNGSNVAPYTLPPPTPHSGAAASGIVDPGQDPAYWQRRVMSYPYATGRDPPALLPSSTMMTRHPPPHFKSQTTLRPASRDSIFSAGSRNSTTHRIHVASPEKARGLVSGAAIPTGGVSGGIRRNWGAVNCAMETALERYEQELANELNEESGYEQAAEDQIHYTAILERERRQRDLAEKRSIAQTLKSQMRERHERDTRPESPRMDLQRKLPAFPTEPADAKQREHQKRLRERQILQQQMMENTQLRNQNRKEEFESGQQMQKQLAEQLEAERAERAFRKSNTSEVLQNAWKQQQGWRRAKESVHHHYHPQTMRTTQGRTIPL